MMLVELTRRLVKKTDKEFFKDEYQKRVDEMFTDKPFPSFIQELRNFSVHYFLVLTNATFSMHRDDLERDFEYSVNLVILKDFLLQSGYSWSAAAKLYLYSAKEEIVVSKVASEYWKLVTAFQSWLRSRLAVIYAEKVAWLEDKFRERHEIYNNLSRQ